MAQGWGPRVKTPWAVQLPAGAARAAGVLRLRSDVRACEAGDALWLQGDDFSEELDLELRKLPGAKRYTVNADESVTIVGRQLPADDLPRGPWSALSAWLSPHPQPAALAGQVEARLSLRVERTGIEQPATVLLTTAAAFSDYAAAAPAVRLRPLRFAAASDGRVVLWGTPLPPMPGRRYADREGVAVPCAFAWSPPLEPAVLRALLGLAAGDLALFQEDGSYEHVGADAFARAGRAAARASHAALQMGGAS